MRLTKDIRWAMWFHYSDIIMIECDSVSCHRRLDCLFNRLFEHRSKKTSKLYITGLCEENSPVTGEFPPPPPPPPTPHPPHTHTHTQRGSNSENASIWWRYHSRKWTCRYGGHYYDHCRDSLFNPYLIRYILGNRKLYLYFLLFFNNEMAWIFEILT